MYTIFTLSFLLIVSIAINVFQFFRSLKISRNAELDLLDFQGVKRALQDYIRNIEKNNRALHVDVQTLSLENIKLREQLDSATVLTPVTSVQTGVIETPATKKKSSKKTKTF